MGKTAYAIETALAFHGEIVSCDSMQLYKYMNIGSAKPTAEEQARVRHYLVDQIDPAQPFSAAKYQELAKAAIEEIFAKGKVPVIAGGTGLYLNALLYDMDFSAPPVIPPCGRSCTPWQKPTALRRCTGSCGSWTRTRRRGSTPTM